MSGLGAVGLACPFLQQLTAVSVHPSVRPSPPLAITFSPSAPSPASRPLGTAAPCAALQRHGAGGRVGLVCVPSVLAALCIFPTCGLRGPVACSAAPELETWHCGRSLHRNCLQAASWRCPVACSHLNPRFFFSMFVTWSAFVRVGAELAAV